MSQAHHGAVSTGADGKKHLTVLSNMDSATVRKLHREYVMPATFPTTRNRSCCSVAKGCI